MKTNTYKLSLPNDYQSEDDAMAMIESGESYVEITIAARAAGMKYIRDTDFGAEWEGTEEQFSACVAALPPWAKRYAGRAEK